MITKKSLFDYCKILIQVFMLATNFLIFARAITKKQIENRRYNVVLSSI